MRKDLEMNQLDSCLNRARTDEPVFVLLARDASAPAAVEHWISQRCATKKNKFDDSQITEAMKLIEDMRRWRKENWNNPNDQTHPVR